MAEPGTNNRSKGTKTEQGVDDRALDDDRTRAQ